jgi:hypothetical protein
VLHAAVAVLLAHHEPAFERVIVAPAGAPSFSRGAACAGTFATTFL